MVSGALLLWETRLVRSVWENLDATHCLASQGIAEKSMEEEKSRVGWAEHGTLHGKVEQKNNR